MHIDTSDTLSELTGRCEPHAQDHYNKIERVAQCYCDHPANTVHIVLRQQLTATRIPEKAVWQLAQEISRGITRL